MAGTADSICSVIVTRPSSSIQEPNEQILRLMHSLGIDISRTREVRKHFSCFYCLLCEIIYKNTFIYLFQMKLIVSHILGTYARFQR